MPDVIPSQQPSPSSSHAGQWGMGALVFGAVVIVSFPLMLLLALGESRQIHANAPRENIELAINGGYLTAYCMMALAGFGLLFGLIGLVVGRRRGQPLGQAIAGTVLCIPASTLAVILYLGISRIGDDLQRFKDVRKGRAAGENVPGLLIPVASSSRSA